MCYFVEIIAIILEVNEREIVIMKEKKELIRDKAYAERLSHLRKALNIVFYINSLVHVRDEKVSLYRHFQNFSSHDSAI